MRPALYSCRRIHSPGQLGATACRRYAAGSGAPKALQRWIDQITSQPPSRHDDTLDPLRAAQLLRTLPTRQHLSPSDVHRSAREGEELGYAHHMVYFQPETMLRNLGADGSSPEYNAPSPYTRRMWAGGSFSWSSSPLAQPLRIGDRIVERRSIDRVEYKSDKDLLFIHQKRELFSAGPTAQVGAEAEAEAAVTEIRTHVFRQPGTPPPPSPSPPASRPPTTSRGPALPPDLCFTYTPTSPLLFRYSALTFNAHKIHYDQPHTLSIERQAGLLVHGPLTATLLVELAAGVCDHHAGSGAEAGGEGETGRRRPGRRRLGSFRYRAVSPIVVDREVQLLGWWTNDRSEIELEAVQEGRVGMKATAVLAEQSKAGQSRE